MALRVCPTPSCPTLIKPGVRRCPACALKYETDRGTATARGYGYQHQQLRASWQPRVDAGTVPCARCHQLIQPGQRWALDHHDDDRSQYYGPSHAWCNNSASGRKAHRDNQ